MKKTVTLFAPCLLLLLGSCASEDGPVAGEGEGIIALHLRADGGVTDAVPATRASQATIVPEVSDLALSLTKADGSYSKEWASAAEFPADQPFGIGSYTMKASWGQPDDEGFEKPYYYGQTEVLVEEGKTTEASLTASLANTMVSISYTEAFRSYFAQYSGQVHSAGGDFITFLSDETRPAYVRPGKVTITLNITKQNGVSATIQPAEFEALARHHYHVTLDVNNGETGEAQLAVIFDDSVVSEDVTVDLSDDILSAPAPVVKAGGFTPGTTYEALELTPASTPLSMTLSAAGGLRSVTLTTQSAQLLAKGFPAEIDLMSANASQQALLRQLGLDVKGLWGVTDKMAIVNFTNVFSNIAGTGSHSFALVVKDKLGKVNEPLILEATTEAVTMNISAVSSAAINATEAVMNVTSNVPLDRSNITVEGYHFGTWAPLTISSAQPAAVSRHRAPAESKTYAIRFAVPADAADLPVRVKFKGTEKATSTVVKSGVGMQLESENNVFATYATFKVTHNPKTALSALTWEVSENGGEFVATTNVTLDAANDRVTIKGLKAGTSYKVRATDGSAAGSINTASATTERALQIPNGNLDAATTTNGSESKWSNVVFEGWGTNNAMTTSQGGNFAYVRISGTIGTTDAVSGNAALIRTVGWGSGNTAIGSSGTSGDCKYTDPGLLHLGATRTARPVGYGSDDNKSNGSSAGPVSTDDLDCGIAFASRPSSLVFQYKYSPKNSADRGYAEISVIDALGRKIVTKTLLLQASSSWQTARLDLEYPIGALKASKLYVKFLSSYDMEYFKRTDANFSGPGFGGNLGKGTFMGSQLYIDEITLAY